MWNGWYNSRYFGMDSLIDCDVNVAVGQVGLGVVQVVQGLKITGTDSNISRLASRWTGVMRRREQMLCNYRTWVFSSFPKLFVLTYYLSENTLNHHGLISVFLYHFFPSLSLCQLSQWGFVLKQVCSPAVPRLISHQSRCCTVNQSSVNKALSSPSLSWPHALGKQKLTDYKREERRGKAARTVLYSHKQPSKKYEPITYLI